tara:strand:- start:176 stop:340 length:165 start_codon:yes stop_codon:yes gene_type:complete
MPVKKKTITDAVFSSLKSKNKIRRSPKQKKKLLTLDEKIIAGFSVFLDSPFKGK